MIFQNCPRCKNEWNKNTFKEVLFVECLFCNIIYITIGSSNALDFSINDNFFISWYPLKNECILGTNEKEIKIQYLPYDIPIEKLERYLLLI